MTKNFPKQYFNKLIIGLVVIVAVSLAVFVYYNSQSN